jgi:sarcosine oxidase gamma subunit
MSERHERLEVRERELHGRVCELIALNGKRDLQQALCAPDSIGAQDEVWPLVPGSVRRATSGRPEALHFAPGRHLVPEPSATLLDQLHVAAGQGGLILIDVAGKWRLLELTGPGASRALRRAIEIESVMSGRECAAVTLFDCPLVISRRVEGFDLWVHASYCESLREALLAHARSTSGAQP